MKLKEKVFQEQRDKAHSDNHEISKLAKAALASKSKTITESEQELEKVFQAKEASLKEVLPLFFIMYRNSLENKKQGWICRA